MFQSLHDSLRHGQEKLPCIRRGGGRRKLLPIFVLVRVRVVANTPNDQTWEDIHESSGFHFKTEGVVELCADLVSSDFGFHDSIPRKDRAVVNLDLVSGATFGATLFIFLLMSAALRARFMTIAVLKEPIGACWTSIALPKSRVFVETLKVSAKETLFSLFLSEVLVLHRIDHL